MSSSRRTVLAMLGLAPATAVGAETFLPAPEKAKVQIGRSNREVIAAAFRRMAENIEAGNVETISFEIHCSIDPDDAVKHSLTTTFFYLPEA